MTKATAGAHSGWRWLAAAITCLVAFFALAVLAEGHRLDDVDRLARSIVHRPGPPLLRSSMEAVSFWGGCPGQTAVVLLAAAVLWRRRRFWAVALPVVMAGAGVLQLVAKWAVDRPRPNLDPWGFPSAHVLSVVVLLGAIAYLVATSDLRRPWRRIAVTGCAVLVCMVAYSRMYLDAHWLSDVMGGFSMGLSYLLGVVWVSARRWRDPTVAPAQVAVVEA